MDLLLKFQDRCKQMLGSADTKFLLAVSGGVDSVVLCDLFYRTKLNFLIAHCNFQLRGEESERDEQFVKSLSVKYGKEVFIKKFETKEYVGENKVSVQVAARELRYEWFRTLAINEGRAKFIVTAHHADDNIETVAMNFFRGTGLKGLIGMDVLHQSILRPLLAFRKKELLEYAQQNILAYVDDSSNVSNYYTRNYFRNELLPAIQKAFPETEENILKNIGRLKQVQQVYDHAIADYKHNLVEFKGDEAHIPILKLKKLSSYKIILWEIIKEKGFTSGQVDEVIKLLEADTGSYIDSGSFRIIKNRKWLIITPKHSEEKNQVIVIDVTKKNIRFNNYRLNIENISHTNFQFSTAPHIGCVDAKDIAYPLLLRKIKQGDYFYPLGMMKKKKISRFLIDQKLSKTEKENVWVLETNRKIIWVVGYRIDERFKIQAGTKDILKITVNDH